MTSSKNGNLVSTPTSYFTGRYVEELRDLYIASMVSGLHSVSIGAPGWGKTDVALSMLLDVFGDGNFGLVRITPATAPEEIEGANDTAILLKESRLVKNVTGTPYDPTNKAVLVDEIGRCSKVLVGSLMFLLDRKDVKNPPPVLSTSNFMPTSVESEALLDRIALWHHITVSPATLNPSAMIAAQLGGMSSRLHVKGTLPTSTQIEDVWDAVPGENAIKAVSDTLEQLTVDASAEGLHPHPRRLTQWSRLIYRMAVYETGNADFNTIPDPAKNFLRFAWPAKSSDEHENWATIVRSNGDPIGAVIDKKMAEAAEKFNEVARLPTVVERADCTKELGKFIQDKSDDLFLVGGDDPRVQEAIDLMTAWFSEAAGGKEVSRA